MRVKKSILAKLVLAIVLLSAILGVAISYMGYNQFTHVLEQQYNDSAYEIAETARTYLNPDKFDTYLSTKQKDEEYDQIEKNLDALVESTNVTFIYIAHVDPSNYKTLTYIYDSVNSSTHFDRYELGLVQEDGIADNYVNNAKNIMEKGERATEYLYVYDSESGAHTTAALPVKNSKGEIIAMLCVEKPMTSLNSARSDYVRNVVIVTIIALIVFLILYLFYLNSEMLRPIGIITKEAHRFALDGEKSAILSEQIHKTDEIGVLAKSLEKMETDIETYIENLTKVTAEKERIGAELNVATQIQVDMLPRIFPPFPEQTEIDLFASMTPAKEVGGDFYDFFMIDKDHVGVVIGDVSGKGVPAALFMVISKTLIKNHAMAGMSPEEIFTLTNEELCEGNEAELFTTSWIGIYEISTGKLQFADAGHDNPILRKKDGSVGYIKPKKKRLMLAGMEGTRYLLNETTLESGDLLILYTDGVPEACNGAGEFYQLKRFEEVVKANPKANSEEIINLVKDDVAKFVGDADPFDDLTMLALEVK